ncbi:hypothetical protein ACP4OV_005448 [Aristida adscensionis]
MALAVGGGGAAALAREGRRRSGCGGCGEGRAAWAPLQQRQGIFLHSASLSDTSRKILQQDQCLTKSELKKALLHYKMDVKELLHQLYEIVRGQISTLYRVWAIVGVGVFAALVFLPSDLSILEQKVAH